MAKTYLILSDSFGRGDDELGRVLARNFLYSLARADVRPARIMLMNGGVRLACEGSDSLDDLRLLAEAGVPVKACGTCLDFLGPKERLAVGEVGTMPASVETLSGDSEVVTLG